MSVTYNYYLGPWVWDDSEPGFEGWRAPTGTVGLIDLRSLADQGLQDSLGDWPAGFFAVDVLHPLSPTEYTWLGTGDCREINTSALMRDAWESVCGYRPEGDKLVDLLWDQLVTGSVVDGTQPAKPLMPTSGGVLEMHLAGHSIVKSEKYQHGKHPHTNKVEDALQRQFGSHHTNSPEHARRVLDFWLEKYRLDRSPQGESWKRFVPPRLRGNVPGPLPHQTTYGDDFNRANENLEATSPWVMDVNSMAIVSNQIEADGSVGAFNIARWGQNLSSDDQTGSVTLGTGWASSQGGAGVTLRHLDANNMYMVFWREANDGLDIRKVVSGTNTILLSDTNLYNHGIAGELVTGSVNGSTITGDHPRYGPVETTDTAITGNLQAGAVNYASGSLANPSPFDNWTVSDVGGGGGGITVSKTSISIGVSL